MKTKTKAQPHKGRLNTATVVQAAIELIEAEGLEALSLGRLARQLAVQTPSLYNHINGLPGLQRELALMSTRDLGEAMVPILPWRPVVRVVRHGFDQHFAIVEPPSDMGAQYECGATVQRDYVPSTTPEYGNYYGALLQVMREGQPLGAFVFVWRRVQGEWRLVSYRAIE